MFMLCVSYIHCIQSMKILTTDQRSKLLCNWKAFPDRRIYEVHEIRILINREPERITVLILLFRSS